MDNFKSVGTNVESEKKSTQKRKKKCRKTSGSQIPSLFTPATSSSLMSGDETDSDQKVKADSGSRSRHPSAVKTKNVHVQTDYDSECVNKFILRKQKYKVVIEKSSIFPSATSSSHASEDQSEAEWVCKTKHDVVPSESLENTTKIVLARTKEKLDKRDSKTKRSTTKSKHKSTRGRKKQLPSVPSSSLTSADASGSGWTSTANRCKTEPVLKKTKNSKKQGKDAKALSEVTMKRNYRLSPTKHKYKSILKKRRRVPGPKCATVNPSGSASNENISNLQVSPFIDLTYWKMTKICCGIIFKGLNGEVMIDAKLYKPCKPGCKDKTPINETTQSNQSSSNANAGDTDFNSASNPSATDSMGPEMDA